MATNPLSSPTPPPDYNAAQPTTATPPPTSGGFVRATIERARSYGYSDDEILGQLAKARPELAPNIQAAQSHGYGSDEIVNRIADVSSMAPTPIPPGLAADHPIRTPGLGEAVPGGLAVTPVPPRVPAAVDPGLGMQEFAQGVEQLASPGLRNKAGGAHKLITGSARIAAIPAAPLIMTNPLTAGAGIVAGTAAGTGTNLALRTAGVPEEYADLASDVAGLSAGYGGAKLANSVGPWVRTTFPGYNSPEAGRAAIEALPKGKEIVKFWDILRRGPEPQITAPQLADYAQKSGVTADQLNQMKPDDLDAFIQRASKAARTMGQNEATRTNIVQELQNRPAPPPTPPPGQKTVEPIKLTPPPGAAIPKPTPESIVADFARRNNITPEQLANMPPDQFKEFTGTVTKAHKDEQFRQNVIAELQKPGSTGAPTPPPTGIRATPPPTPPGRDNIPSGGIGLKHQDQATILNHNDAIENKVNTLADYLDHIGMDPEKASQMSPAEMNTHKNAAWDWAQQTGRPTGKTRYKDFKPEYGAGWDDSWTKAVNQLRSRRTASPTPPPR